MVGAVLNAASGMAAAWARPAMAAVPAAFLLKSLLYEVQPLDLPTLFAVPLLLASAALAACWLPARRASRIDPSTALRSDG